ncbi:ABC transporter substrate-binding protein [Bartonella sp. DGB2]|uniref:ABC transporter substrate-binding protein n=1 Tax=Bartonella sp. DGB2 TaxID=3388426 RepID=UPI00398FB027
MKKLVKCVIYVVALFWAIHPLYAKTLIYCSKAPPGGFDPAAYSSGDTMGASRPIYNQLVEFEKGGTNVAPALATHWDISPDGKEYTFYLRRGVKFQNTPYFKPSRDFNADDVIFSFERQWKVDHPWHAYSVGLVWEYFSSMNMDRLLKSLDKIDDYTVKFVLNSPNAPFLLDLGMSFSSILSKEYADQLQKVGRMADINQKPIGTGPFIFVTYQKDAMIRYKANPDYFRGRQPLDHLVFAITLDPAVRAEKLKANECQVAAAPPPAMIAELKKDSRLNVLQTLQLNVIYMAYNTEMPPFDRVEVRRALNMAIDKKAIVNAIYEGTARVAKSPLPPAMLAYDSALPEDIYDPIAARALLDKAGVKDLHMKIWAPPFRSAAIPNGRRMAEMMQDDLKKVGVDVEIVTMEWGEYLRRLNEKGRDGAAIMQWSSDNGDPDNFLGVITSCAGIGATNYARWCNPAFDAIVEKARQTNDKAARIELYKKAQILFREEAPWLLIAHSTFFVPMSKKVKNYVIDPIQLRFDGVDIDE